MNKRKLAEQALRYLSSLGKPLPDDSDTEFYKQNEADYNALLRLNQKGLGSSVEELQALVDAPLSSAEVKATVCRLMKLDALIISEYDKQDTIDKTPKYWDGFFSGYKATPTNRCKQLLENSNNRLEKYSKEQSKLFLTITMQQAIEGGYAVVGMEASDFKIESCIQATELI